MLALHIGYTSFLHVLVHFDYIGIVRKLFPLTFKVGDSPKGRLNNSERVKPKKLNDELVRARVPSEWQRRTRRIERKSVKDLKASGNHYCSFIHAINTSFYSISHYLLSHYNFLIAEWRTLVLAFGPIVILAIPPGTQRLIWVHLIYILRWLIVSEEEEAIADRNQVEILSLIHI